MRNPWLDIPLDDYEAHMAQPAIAQAALIADQLNILIETHAPSSVAIIGCAGGNGFDRLIDGRVDRVAGIDINPRYIEEARQRYAGRMPGLTLLVGDIQSAGQLFEPVDLIYAALVLEYVDVARAMSALRLHCKPGGILAVLVQLPHKDLPQVSPSPYASLRSLEPAMHLVSAADLHGSATVAGFTLQSSKTVESAGGKVFMVATYVA